MSGKRARQLRKQAFKDAMANPKLYASGERHQHYRQLKRNWTRGLR